MKTLQTVVLVASLTTGTALAQAQKAPANPLNKAENPFLPFFDTEKETGVPVEVTPGVPFLYGVALSHGAGSGSPELGRGEIGDLRLCRFDRVGNRVLLVHLPTGFREEGRPAQGRALDESFATSVLASFTADGERNGRVVIDVASFVLSGDNARPWTPRGWFHDASRSLVLRAESGAYPRNTEIETLMTFATGDADAGVSTLLPDPRVLTLRIRHTFLRLPEAGFEPQQQDPRIGFFGPEYRDLSAPRDKPLERKLAARWRLAKRDPAAAVSEPVEPIVLYLDPAIPERHRQAVRNGALAWNRAFEAAGFKDALVLRDLPEGASFADARYSGIQWVHRAASPTSFGRIRTDPRTGEIVHAVVSLDSGHIREGTGLPRAQGAQSVEACGLSPAAMPGLRLDDKVVEGELAYIAAHEVGHILGLTHNFAASTYHGSVMDYLPAEYRVEDDRLVVHQPFPAGVGDYDLMAIRWAYTPGTAAEDREAIVREGLARGLVYPQPRDARWARYDLGPDPVAWLETKLAQRRILLSHLGPDDLQPGESLQRLYDHFDSAYTYHHYALEAVARLVGGVRVSNSLQGDGQRAIDPVPVEAQRRALQAVLATLAPEELEIPPSLDPILLLGPVPGARTNLSLSATVGQSPARNAEEMVAFTLGLLVLDEDQLTRLTLPQESPGLTLDEVLAALVKTAWTGRAAPSLRAAATQRAVQRVTVAALALLATSAPLADTKATARDHLLRLRTRLANPATADRITRAHNSLLRSQIDELLDPRPKAASLQ